MAVQVRVPAADEDTEEVEIARWVKQKGDTVSTGDVLLEIETGKATMEIESEAEGTLLEILAQENETVKVGKVIAIIGEPGEPIDDLLE